MSVCLLYNSRTIKPRSLKLCMHTKKTPRKCKSENLVFGCLVKTVKMKSEMNIKSENLVFGPKILILRIKIPLLKIINGLI